MARRKPYAWGIYRINEKREILETIDLFDDRKAADKLLAAKRAEAVLANENQYNIALLPCGPKNEGLLP